MSRRQTKATAIMQILTRRFLLRDFEESDRAAFLSYQADLRNLEYYGPDEIAPQHAERLFDTFLSWANELPRRNYQVAIVKRDSPSELIGCCGVRLTEQHVGELGIELSPKFWGRYGYAAEAARAILDFGFNTLGLSAISGSTVSVNARVSRLARWFGAEITSVDEGPAWMPARGWNTFEWQISRNRWEQLPPNSSLKPNPLRRSA